MRGLIVKEGFALKKILALIVIAVMLITTVSGCGMLKKAKDIKDGLDGINDFVNDLEDQFGDDTDDYDDNDDDDDDDDSDVVSSVFAHEVYYPQDSIAILEKFQEFGYSWEEKYEDGSENNFSLHYKSAGTEEVDGVSTEVFDVTHIEGEETDQYRIWFNGEWEPIKATHNGEEMEAWEGAVLTFALSIYSNYVQLTQTVVDVTGELDTFSYSLDEQTSEVNIFGLMDIYQFSSIFSPVITTYGLVDLDDDGVQDFVMIKNIVKDSEHGWVMRVTHAVPR